MWFSAHFLGHYNMKATGNFGGELSDKTQCVVMVIYEDDAALRRTMRACDRLVKSLWSTVDFKFHWWRTRFLADPNLAAGAAQEAEEADLFIVCSEAGAVPSSQLKCWFGDWIKRRSGRVGAVVNLTTTGSTTLPDLAPGEIFLRDVCNQAKLDFLGAFPSPEVYTESEAA